MELLSPVAADAAALIHSTAAQKFVDPRDVSPQVIYVPLLVTLKPVLTD